MRDYRNTALRTILVAALLIIALLWYARGQFRHTLWVGLTVTSALAVTIAVISSIHGSLTVIHLVALLLVLGLGLDYALFLSRVEPADRAPGDRQRRYRVRRVDHVSVRHTCRIIDPGAEVSGPHGRRRIH